MLQPVYANGDSEVYSPSKRKNEAVSFYEFSSKIGYLTPLQRKRLREKRNIGYASEIETSPEVSKSNKKGKEKSKAKTPRPKTKGTKKSKEKLTLNVATLNIGSEVRNEKKKFFRSRTSGNLQKPTLTTSLGWKQNLQISICNANKGQPPKKKMKKSPSLSLTDTSSSMSQLSIIGQSSSSKSPVSMGTSHSEEEVYTSPPISEYKSISPSSSDSISQIKLMVTPPRSKVKPKDVNSKYINSDHSSEVFNSSENSPAYKTVNNSNSNNISTSPNSSDIALAENNVVVPPRFKVKPKNVNSKYVISDHSPEVNSVLNSPVYETVNNSNNSSTTPNFSDITLPDSNVVITPPLSTVKQKYANSKRLNRNRTPKVLNSLENNPIYKRQNQFKSSIERESFKINNEWFDFDWPSKEVLRDREIRAREAQQKQRESLLLNSADDSPKSIDNYNKGTRKLYPVFNLKNEKLNTSKVKSTEKKVQPTKGPKLPKKVSKGLEQLIIDAGQKKIGATMCSSCGMLYSIGDDDDEKLHFNFHNKFLTNLKFPGWKKERVIAQFVEGKIIMVRKEDPNFMLKKVDEVLEVVNRNLGFPATCAFPRPNPTVLLFVSFVKRVIGCLVAESVTSARKVVLDTSASEISSCLPNQPKVGNWCSGSEIFKTVCGVSRIWVAPEFRRCKIATRLVNSLRLHFVYGYPIKNDELAFSDPSIDGREFAAAYTGTDNFLVYK